MGRLGLEDEVHDRNIMRRQIPDHIHVSAKLTEIEARGIDVKVRPI
jgi:hypothetical protein